MKFVKLVAIAVLGMTTSMAIAADDSSTQRLGRASQIQGGSLINSGAAADASGVYGRGAPGHSKPAARMPLAESGRSADSVRGRA